MTDAAKRWRHKVRGTEYDEIGTAELQASTGDVEEGALLTVYRGDDGKLWARRAREFGDGRFERVDAAPSPATLQVPDPAGARERDRATARREKLIRLIREQLMSLDYPVSQFELDFADAILALPLDGRAGVIEECARVADACRENADRIASDRAEAGKNVDAALSASITAESIATAIRKLGEVGE